MSSYGQGSIAFSPRNVAGAAPGPPFPANSAVNGLSVNGAGQIVLGDDLGGGLADLLNDREIEMAGFLFQFINSGGRKFLIDNANSLYEIGDIDGLLNGSTFLVDDNSQVIAGFNTAGNALILNMQGRVYEFGDIDTVGNGLNLQLDDPNQLAQLRFNGDPYLLLDNVSNAWAFGDYNNFVKPVIDMAYVVGGTNYISEYVQDATGNAYANSFLRVNEALGQPQWTLDTNGFVDNVQTTQSENAWVTSINGTNRLSLDNVTNTYGIGQLGLAGNATRLRLLDNIEGFVFDSTTGNMLSARNDNLQFGFGDGAGTNYGILIDGVAGRTDLNGGGDEWVLINTATNSMQLGRNDGLGVNGFINFDVTNNLIQFQGNSFVAGELDFVNQVFQFGGSGPTNAASGAGVDDPNSFAYLRTTGVNAMEFYMDGMQDKFFFSSLSTTGIFNINGTDGFTGTVTPVNSITVVGGIVTNVS